MEGGREKVGGGGFGEGGGGVVVVVLDRFSLLLGVILRLRFFVVVLLFLGRIVLLRDGVDGRVEGRGGGGGGGGNEVVGGGGEGGSGMGVATPFRLESALAVDENVPAQLLLLCSALAVSKRARRGSGIADL